MSPKKESRDPQRPFPSYLRDYTPHGTDYVLEVYPGEGFDIEKASALGGKQPVRWFRKQDVWVYRATDYAGMAKLLEALRDMGVAFLAAGPGWPIGHVFEHMRTEGLVSGRYLAIWWRGPGLWETAER